MARIGIGLLSGLLGGVLGGLLYPALHEADAPAPLPHRAAPAPDAPPPAPAPGGPALAAPGLEARIARLEAALERIEARLGAAPGAAAGAAGPDEAPTLEGLAARLAVLEERVAQPSEAPAEPERRRVTLAEAARELGLSAGEEHSLRQIYAEYLDKACALVAVEPETAADVRRELEDARNRPERVGALTTKYLPRLLNRFGDFIALEAERQGRIQETLGAERAALLGERYDVEEANPLGMGGGWSVSASTRRE